MLPVPAYRPHPLDARLAAALPAGSLYAVGGRVRDELRLAAGEAVDPRQDLDYVVVGVELDDLRGRLQGLGSVDVVGASFAVLKATIDGTTVDIALPRRERSSGPGHRAFEVQSGPDIPLVDDLGRRDFRMNMLARSLPDGRLLDPYGGQADIRARRIDLLRPEAFAEDPLRMLRCAQFAARFGYEVTPPTAAALQAAAELVGTVSSERVRDELEKLLEQAPRPSIGLELLRTAGLLDYVLPELTEGIGVEQNEWHAYDVYHHALATVDAAPAGDRLLRWAALLHDVGKPRTKEGPHFYRHEQIGAQISQALLQRLRLAGDDTATVEHLVRQHMYVADPQLSDAALRRFIRRVEPAHLARQFALRRADIVGSGLPARSDRNERFEARVWAELARRPPLRVADLALDGEAIVNAMIAKGLAPATFRGDARVGAALRWLLEQVTDRPERNDLTTLPDLLNEYLDALASGQAPASVLFHVKHQLTPAAGGSSGVNDTGSHNRARESKGRRRQEHDGR